MSGPLAGLIVVEMAGLGPAPFAGMVLADLGAEVIRVERPGTTKNVGPSNDLMNRGKRSFMVNLKEPDGVEVLLRLVASSNALIEGFRPGVMERLGIGPGVCLASNKRLVYGRMTGWGQDGPMAPMAGHDIDYIALSGALGAIGPPGEPVPPLNLVGDYGGGGMLLVIGVLAALHFSSETGRGQVVDAAMVDGSALLMTSHHGFLSEGWWQPRRGVNLLDGGAPFYRVYETSDGLHIAVGALEPQFFTVLVEGLGLDPIEVGDQNDRDRWPEMRKLFAQLFKTKTRDQWAEHFAGKDACVAPVLTMAEAPNHPHNVARGTFTSVSGVVQPAPAPRFSDTPTSIEFGPVDPGASTDDVMERLGFSQAEIGKLHESGVIG